jgi:hypothetical protein
MYIIQTTQCSILSGTLLTYETRMQLRESMKKHMKSKQYRREKRLNGWIRDMSPGRGGVLVLYPEMINTCNVCNKRVKSHDKFTRCTLCSYNTHFKCLPIYDEDDYNYAQNPNGTGRVLLV